jgi:hypothetical protein
MYSSVRVSGSDDAVEPQLSAQQVDDDSFVEGEGDFVVFGAHGMP